jgi:hypothetical protein
MLEDVVVTVKTMFLLRQTYNNYIIKTTESPVMRITVKTNCIFVGVKT